MMQPKAAFIVTAGRGLVISGLLIFLLLAIAGADSIWYAMLITEGLTALYAVSMMIKYTRKLPEKTEKEPVLQ